MTALGRVRARCRLAATRIIGGPRQWWEGGIYENTYMKEDGVWRIQILNYKPQWHADFENGWANTPQELRAVLRARPIAEGTDRAGRAVIDAWLWPTRGRAVPQASIAVTGKPMVPERWPGDIIAAGRAREEEVSVSSGDRALYMLIDGERVRAGDRRTFTVINPATGAPSASCRWPIAADLDRALDGGARLRYLARLAPQQRAAVLKGAARLMAERVDHLARIATMEEGKTFPEARIEVMTMSACSNSTARRLSGSTAGCWSADGTSLDGDQGAGRPGRRLRALELPARQSGPQARGADRRGLLGDPQARRGDAGLGIGVLQALLDAGLPEEVAQAVFGVPDEVSRHLLLAGSSAS